MSSFEAVLHDRSDDEEEEEENSKVRGSGGNNEDKDEDEDEEEVDDRDDDDDEADDDEDAAEDEEETNENDEDANIMLQRQRLGLLDDQDLENPQGGSESYLKKFDASLRFQMMDEFHPELLMENNQDVQARTLIQRDEFGNISDPYHRTLPILTKYERARILGERAKQLNAGARPTVDVANFVIDGYLIALAEFEAKKIPFIIKRPLRNGSCEYWKFSDLEAL